MWETVDSRGLAALALQLRRTAQRLPRAASLRKIRKQPWVQESPEALAALHMLETRYPAEQKLMTEGRPLPIYDWLMREFRRGRVVVPPGYTQMMQHYLGAKEMGDQEGAQHYRQHLDGPRPDAYLWPAEAQTAAPGEVEPVQPGMVLRLGQMLSDLRQHDRSLDLMNHSFQDVGPIYKDWKQNFHARDPNSGDRVHDFGDGWSMRRVTDPTDAYYEAEDMQNCVGNKDKVEGIVNGAHHLFSLRDPQNSPHANVLIRPQTTGGSWEGGTLADLRGKQNKRPQPQYADYLKQWFSSLNNPPVWGPDPAPPGIDNIGTAEEWGLPTSQREPRFDPYLGRWDFEDVWNFHFANPQAYKKVRNMLKKNNQLNPRNEWGLNVLESEFPQHGTLAEFLHREYRKGRLTPNHPNADNNLTFYRQNIENYQDQLRRYREEQEQARQEGDEYREHRYDAAIQRYTAQLNDQQEKLRAAEEKLFTSDPTEGHFTVPGVNDRTTGYPQRLTPDHLDEIAEIMRKRKQRGEDNANIMKNEVAPLMEEAKEAVQLKKALASGQVLHRYPNDWTMRYVDTADAAKLEGELMGHCMGQYAPQVESGDSLNYSLRDAQGRPHVSFEIKPKRPAWDIDWDKIAKGVPGNYGPHSRQPCPNCGGPLTRNGECTNCGFRPEPNPNLDFLTPDMVKTFRGLHERERQGEKLGQQTQTCPTCNGNGYELDERGNVRQDAAGNYIYCPTCNGSGRSPADPNVAAYQDFKKKAKGLGLARPDFREGTTYQIQGKGNVAPEMKYVPYVKEWAESIPYEDRPKSTWSAYFKSKPVIHVNDLEDIDKGIDEFGFAQPNRSLDWNEVVNSLHGKPAEIAEGSSKYFKLPATTGEEAYQPALGQKAYEWANQHGQLKEMYRSLNEWGKPPPGGEGEKNISPTGETDEKGFPMGKDQNGGAAWRYAECPKCQRVGWMYRYGDGYMYDQHGCGGESGETNFQPTPLPQASESETPNYTPYQATAVQHLGALLSNHPELQGEHALDPTVQGQLKCISCGGELQPCNCGDGVPHYRCAQCGGIYNAQGPEYRQAKVAHIEPKAHLGPWGTSCHCGWHVVNEPLRHIGKMLTCESCGDLLEHGQCKRCDWGGWSDAMPENPQDPTRGMHPGIQSKAMPWSFPQEEWDWTRST